MKKTCESDISECRSGLLEEARVREELLLVAFEEEKSVLIQEKNEMVQEFKDKCVELEQTLASTCQDYAVKLQRLNEK